jgi:hypothetical protein
VKCFQHRAADALGTCKACGRGLCGECAETVGRWLACRGPCEQDVRRLAAIVGDAPKAQRRAATIYRIAGVAAFVLAVACFALSLVFPG